MEFWQASLLVFWGLLIVQVVIIWMMHVDTRGYLSYVLFGASFINGVAIFVSFWLAVGGLVVDLFWQLSPC